MSSPRLHQPSANRAAMCVHSEIDTMEVRPGDFYPMYLCRHPANKKTGVDVACRMVWTDGAGTMQKCDDWRPYEGHEALRPEEYCI